MEERLVKLEAALTSLQSDVSESKGGIRALSEGLGQMAVDLAVVKTEVTNHVNELKRDVAEIKSTTSNRSSEMWRQAFYFLAGAIISYLIAVSNRLGGVP